MHVPLNSIPRVEVRCVAQGLICKKSLIRVLIIAFRVFPLSSFR